MTLERLLSLLSFMTTKGQGTQSSTMISTARRRPRTASAVSSVSRRAKRLNCSSFSISDLQVADRLGGGVEHVLHSSAVHTTAQLADASSESGERCLQRGVRLEHRAGSILDPLQYLSLTFQQAATEGRHS